MNRFLTLTCLIAIAMTIGCRSPQLQNDQDQIRVAVMDMYTNQIMDNLIRAHNGFPFVQMQYSSITGTVNTSGGGDLALAFPPVNLGMSAARSGQLTITANPVVDNDAVYLAYVDFVKPEAGNFFCTTQAPPCGAAHISVCCEDKYYWVPTEKRGEFLRLSLATSVMSKGGGIKIPQSYTTTLVTLLDTKDQEGVLKATENLDGKRLSVRAQFEDYLPAAPGTMTAKIGEEQVTFEVNRLTTRETFDGEGDVSKRGDRTRYLKLTWDFDDIGLLPSEIKDALEGQTVKLKIEGYPPSFGTTGDVLKAIQQEMQLFRLNQQVR